MNMSKLLPVAALSIWTALYQPALAGQYEAIISCGMNGQHMNILPCFTDTELKVSKDGQAVVYKVYNLRNAGQEYADGLHIELPSSFSIVAQNSQKTLILELVVKDSNGSVVYQDQAGQYGVVSVRN